MILVDLTATCFSEKIMISYSCIHGFMPNLPKKSWMVSIYDSVDSVEMSRNIVTINNKNHRNSELGIGETMLLI